MKINFAPCDYKPKRLASGLIGFRSPFAINLAPGQNIEVFLQTRCDYPLLFVSPETFAVQPQQDISVNVKNTTQSPVRFEAGDVIARAYPLIPVDFDVE